MPITNQEKVLSRSRSSLDDPAAVPIKKRRFLCTPSPPCEIPSPVQSYSGISEEKKSDLVNAPEDLSPELVDHMPGRKSELLMPPSPFSQINGEDDTTVTCELPSLLAESAIPKAGCKLTIQDKFTAVEGITVKQEERDEQTIQTKSKDDEIKDDANYACPDRSTWDLNTTMDAWEGSSADSSVTDRTDFDKQDFGGKHNKGPSLYLKQTLSSESSGSKQLGNTNESNKSDNNLKSANPCTSLVNSNSEASLDLGLKPSFLLNPCITSGKHEARGNMPFLSLSMKPMLPTSIPPMAIGRTVKSEPVEREIPKNTRKVQLVSLKSLKLKQVKSKPCEQRDTPNAVGDQNLTCIRAVKPEPLEDHVSGITKSPKGKSYPIGQAGHSLAPQMTQMHQKACIMMPDTVTSNDSSSMGTPISGNDMSTGTPAAPDSTIVKTEPSALVSKSPILNGNDMNLLQEAFLPKAFTLNATEADKHIPAEGTSEFSSNAHCLPSETLLNDITRNSCQPCGNNKVVQANEVESKTEVSSEILEGPCDTACKSDNSPAGAMDTVNEQEGKNNEECDGGARNPASDVTNEGPNVSMPSFVDKKETEVENSEGDNACGSKEHDGGLDTKVRSGSSPAGVPSSKQEAKINEDCENPGARNPASDVTNEFPSVLMPSFVNKKETEVASSKEGNSCGSKEHDGSLESKVECGASTVEAPNTIPGIQSLSKTIKKTLKDHPKNNKGSKKKIKTSDLSARTSLSDNQSGVTSNSQHKIKGPKNTENSALAKDANDRGNGRRIVYVNSASNSLASDKKKLTSDRSIPYQGERERPFRRSFRGERSPHGGRREEFRIKSSREIGSEGRYGNRRSRTDWLNPQHGDRNLTSVRYSRPLRRCGEFSIGADGSSRPGRRSLTNEDEMDNLSRYPSERRFGHRPSDISPRSITERVVPDFVLLPHEEMMMNMQVEGIHTSGGRSLSPSLRRAGPPRLLNDGLQPSSRSQQHSTHHSDGFSEPREFVRRESMRHRSPPIRRINRMQLPQGLIVRRRRSPPYIGQAPNDMVDVGPFRESFPRPARGFTSNMRQQLIAAEENTEEHYLGQEFHVGNEFVEDGRCIERTVPIHSFRQQLIAGDTPSNYFHVEDGRTLRLRPVPESSGPRNFDVRFRNRLGNSSGRLGGIVEDEGDYSKQHEELEWHDAARQKRRRF